MVSRAQLERLSSRIEALAVHNASGIAVIFMAPGETENAAMESFFSSLKVERVGRKIYRTRDEARADVFDYIERFYNPRRRHSTIGYLSPMEFEAKVRVA